MIVKKNMFLEEKENMLQSNLFCSGTSSGTIFPLLYGIFLEAVGGASIISSRGRDETTKSFVPGGGGLQKK